MIGKNETIDDEIEDGDDSQGGAKQRSTIGFPYMNLDDAVEVANAIHNNVGTGECDDDQLAPWLKLSPKSSGYRTRIYTARMFGLIEPSSLGGHKLSQLGRSIVDRNQARAAKADAFLRVPLYRAVFDNYRGGVLPPPAAFERDIVGLGVAEKQKGRARQVFEKAAEQAGYFEQGKDRLVRPGNGGGKGAPIDPPPPPPGGGGSKGSGGGGGEEPPDRHALIEALVDVLPKPGDTFSIDDLADWLRAAEVNMRIVYKIKGRVKIEVADVK